MRPALYIFFLLFCSALFSQTAVTDDGRKIMLFSNKTWEPASEELGKFSTLEAYTAGDQKVIISSEHTWKFKNKETESLYENTVINKKKFTAAKAASSLAHSKRVDAGFYYDPKKWIILEEQPQSHLGEILLQGFANKELYASFGSSELDEGTTLRNLKDQLLTDFLMNPSYYKIKKTELRTVNGIEMFYIMFYAKKSGEVVLQNYFIPDTRYFSVISARIPEKKFASYEKDMQDFINGMVAIKTEKYVERINVQAPAPPPPLTTEKSR
ncbi:hypothetical protein DRF67_06505 [Chryseobacterium pennipullorum]|uniref:Uncharacterized protein n=2 Tax=Chryseobacterium pennipullorum TaxID=2258963 RepID=A0A3D9B5H8_9FLAO|nr:hypothetical protein DRF67_06505 [Chryseobacterium pennipullorum]